MTLFVLNLILASALQQGPPQAATPLPPTPATGAQPAAAQSATPPAAQTTALPAAQAEAARAAEAPVKPQTPAEQRGYVISPEDALQIVVWKEPGLSAAAPVRPDGKISLSLLGDVQAAGLTPTALGDAITEQLKKYLTDPSVTVTVTSFAPKMVYLTGEVAHVGPVSLTPGLTLMQAISVAGGLTPFAHNKKIYVLRKKDTTTVRLPFDYRKALKTGDEQGITLQAGDTVVVP